MIIDFVTRRQAATRRERELRAEFEAEDERDHKISLAHHEFEARMKFEQVQRQKYEQAMSAKTRDAVVRPDRGGMEQSTTLTNRGADLLNKSPA